MEKYSAIQQMILGHRGNIESVKYGKEHNKVFDKFCNKYEEFTQKYSDNPEIITLFNEVCDAADKEQAFAEEDLYIEGFRFGVLIGIDIMSENSKND